MIGVLGDDFVIDFDDVCQEGKSLDLGSDEINENFFTESLWTRVRYILNVG